LFGFDDFILAFVEASVAQARAISFGFAAPLTGDQIVVIEVLFGGLSAPSVVALIALVLRSPVGSVFVNELAIVALLVVVAFGSSHGILLVAAVDPV
jgi:hypothetical protein